MKFQRSSGVVAAAAMILGANPALSQPVPPALNPAEIAAIRAARETMPDSPGSGPYRAIREEDPDLPNHVIYRPDHLDLLGGRKLGVVAWGNGGCGDDGASARIFLEEIASWGYIVIAPGRARTGPGAMLPPPAPLQPPTALQPPKTTSADVRSGLDWVLLQATRPGNRYRGLIDKEAIAVAGHSCGGLQAIELAADPRVRTALVLNSGVFVNKQNPIPGLTVDKAMLAKFHSPVIYMLGGPSDVAYPNGTDDFQRIGKVAAVLVNLPVGHGGTCWQPYGGAMAHVMVDWLDWQLRGDISAARTFLGVNCRLCNGTEWTIERKNLR